jgi:phage terminase small subunit
LDLAIARAEVTVESLINEAEAARRAAMEARQYSAAVAAIKEKGILSGKRVERNEQGAPGEFADLENMTADELGAFVAKTAAEMLHRPRIRLTIR